MNQMFDEDDPAAAGVSQKDFTNETPRPILLRDILDEIFKYVSFIDRIKCERVCSAWKSAVESSHLKQTAIGNAPVKYSKIERCHEKSHIVTKLDLVKKIHLTNPQILDKIVRKCPNLKSIQISDANDSCYRETCLPEESECIPSARSSFAMNATRDPEEFFAESTDPVITFRHAIRLYSSARHAPVLAGCETPDRTTRLPLKLLVQTLSKCNLECLDLSGIPSDEFDLLKFLKLLCNRKNRVALRHMKCGALNEVELRYILTELPISEISAPRKAFGASLSVAPASLTKLAVKTLDDRGLETYIKTDHKDSLVELFFCNTSAYTLWLISYHLQSLVKLNLSFSERLNTSSPLSQLRHLQSLKHLYLKFPPSTGDNDDKFDRYMREIFESIDKLHSLRLVNCPLGDVTFKTIARTNRMLRIFDFRMRPDYKIGALVLNFFSTLPFLHTCYISCINTFDETSVIQMLMRAKCIRKLKLYGCTELIPERNIFFAALQRARSMSPIRKLSIDIQIEEPIAIHIAKASSIPHNLKFTMKTLNDYYTTRDSLFQQHEATGQPICGDFDDDLTNH